MPYWNNFVIFLWDEFDLKILSLREFENEEKSLYQMTIPRLLGGSVLVLSASVDPTKDINIKTLFIFHSEFSLPGRQRGMKSVYNTK